MSKLVHRKCRTVVALGAMALLVGGCSGSSESKDNFVIRPIPSFAATNELSQSLFQKQTGVEKTQFARLPDVGTATYLGAASYVTSSERLVDKKYPEYEQIIISDPEYVSRVRLVADFASDSVSGDLDSFRDSGNGSRRIDIKLEGGTIGTSDFGNDAVFGGTLSGTNIVGEETLNFTGNIAGQFLGARGDMILGSVGFNDGFTGKGSPIVGVFTAEQP
ncbi:MAG: hypothetical protein INF92_19065 [Rhodobacter sp.]|nr:hypothetical protein [Rhodobacter sp.]